MKKYIAKQFITVTISTTIKSKYKNKLMIYLKEYQPFF